MFVMLFKFGIFVILVMLELFDYDLWEIYGLNYVWMCLVVNCVNFVYCVYVV